MIGATPISELLVALVLFWLYPEKGRTRYSWVQVLRLIGIGIALALFWIFAFAWGRTVFPVLPSGSEVAVIVGLMTAVITAPLFEEKIVRYLLLEGGAGFIGPWAASILVSLLFALAHQGSVIWSFVFSLAMCWLALARKVGTLQRAIIHGTVNAIIFGWYFTSGFGLFS